MLDKDDILKETNNNPNILVNNKEEVHIKKASANMDEAVVSVHGSSRTKKKNMKDLEDIKKSFPWMKKPAAEYWYNTDLINETADKALCKLWMVVGVCVVFIIAEVVGGVIANS